LRSLCWPEGKSPLCDDWDLPLRCDAWDLPVVLSVDFPSGGANLGSAGGFLLMIDVRLPCALPRTSHLASSTRASAFWKGQGLLAFGRDKQRAAQDNAPYWASSWLETLFSSCSFFSFGSHRHMYMYSKGAVGDYMKQTFLKGLKCV
jgi:hypothetical protein